MVPSDYKPNKSTKNAKESSKDKSEVWKPLNYLVEAANRTKTVKSCPQSSGLKEEQINGTDNEVHMGKITGREYANKSKIQDENNDNIPVSPAKVRARRLQSQKKRDLEASAQALIDAAGVIRERTGPIWLCLVPSVDQ